MKPTAIILLFLMLLSFKTQAQWQSDVRLTYDEANSLTAFNNAKCIAVNGNDVHIVWYDDRSPGFGIYYKHSTDGGLNFSNDLRLTPDSVISSYQPSIAISGSTVHVVWHDYRNDNTQEIYYRHSNDAGLTWATEQRLTTNLSSSENPCLAVLNNEVHVVWTDTRDGDYNIYYKRSLDGGINWEADFPLVTNSSTQSGTCISVSASAVHVSWLDSRDGNIEVYYKQSTDAGTNWGADTRITNDISFTSVASLTNSGGSVYLIWHDQRDGNNEIYFKKSADNGINWSSDIRLTNDANQSLDPDIAALGANINVVWWDDREGNFEIYHKLSSDGGLTWTNDLRLTNAPNGSHEPHIAMSLSAVHVIWADQRDTGNNNEIYYKRNGPDNPASIEAVANSFLISPNPANGSFTVLMNSTNNNSSIEILSITGELVHTELLLNDRQIINCDFLKTGIYFVRILNGKTYYLQKLCIFLD